MLGPARVSMPFCVCAGGGDCTAIDCGKCRAHMCKRNRVGTWAQISRQVAIPRTVASIPTLLLDLEVCTPHASKPVDRWGVSRVACDASRQSTATLLPAVQTCGDRNICLLSSQTCTNENAGQIPEGTAHPPPTPPLSVKLMFLCRCPLAPRPTFSL